MSHLSTIKRRYFIYPKVDWPAANRDYSFDFKLMITRVMRENRIMILVAETFTTFTAMS